MKKSSGRKQHRALIRQNVHEAGAVQAQQNETKQKKASLKDSQRRNKGRRNLIADKRKQLQKRQG